MRSAPGAYLRSELYQMLWVNVVLAGQEPRFLQTADEFLPGKGILGGGYRKVLVFVWLLRR
jgi:hypothetical protein